LVAAIWCEICGTDQSLLRCPVDTARFQEILVLPPFKGALTDGVIYMGLKTTTTVEAQPPEDRAKDDSSHRHGAEVLEEVSAEDGDNHSLLRGAEVLVEDRVKDDRHRLGHRVDFLEDRVRVVEVDGHRDQCRDAHTPSHRSPGITDKRTTHRGVLAAMAFLQGWVMS